MGEELMNLLEPVFLMEQEIMRSEAVTFDGVTYDPQQGETQIHATSTINAGSTVYMTLTLDHYFNKRAYYKKQGWCDPYRPRKRMRERAYNLRSEAHFFIKWQTWKHRYLHWRERNRRKSLKSGR